MKINRPIFVTALLLSVAFALARAPALFAGSVLGASSFTQFGQPSKEALRKARAAASADFRPELHIWLKENMRIDVDTANTIKKFAFDRLAERCLKPAREENAVKGRVWTLSLAVPEDDVRDALRAHNDHYDSQAVSHFLAARDSDPAVALPGAISALCAAMAKIEPAGARSGVNVDDIRANVQILFDKMEAKSAATVIEGRPGALPQKYPTAVFSLDGKPLQNFHITATVQNGRVLARLMTDSRGELPLKNYKVPFVHNGSMLNVTPDARDYIKSDDFIKYKDLGIRFTKGQDIAYIYKVPALTYKLEYKAASLDKSIVIPSDFTADAHVRKYLKDFCGLTPAKSAADLNIKVVVEFSKNTHNDTEEDGYAMRAVAEAKGLSIDKTGRTQFEKRYNFGVSMQPGEYFWEASGALRELIANTLGSDDR
jgi:hypothetical protein